MPIIDRALFNEAHETGEAYSTNAMQLKWKAQLLGLSNHEHRRPNIKTLKREPQMCRALSSYYQL